MVGVDAVLVLAVLAGTGEAQHGLNHVVNHTGQWSLRRSVQDLLAETSADDELAGLEVFQVVGDCGAGHAGPGGQVGDRFLPVA